MWINVWACMHLSLSKLTVCDRKKFHENCVVALDLMLFIENCYTKLKHEQASQRPYVLCSLCILCPLFLSFHRFEMKSSIKMMEHLCINKFAFKFVKLIFGPSTTHCISPVTITRILIKDEIVSKQIM